MEAVLEQGGQALNDPAAVYSVSVGCCLCPPGWIKVEACFSSIVTILQLRFRDQMSGVACVYQKTDPLSREILCSSGCEHVTACPCCLADRKEVITAQQKCIRTKTMQAPTDASDRMCSFVDVTEPKPVLILCPVFYCPRFFCQYLKRSTFTSVASWHHLTLATVVMFYKRKQRETMKVLQPFETRFEWDRWGFF